MGTAVEPPKVLPPKKDPPPKVLLAWVEGVAPKVVPAGLPPNKPPPAPKAFVVVWLLVDVPRLPKRPPVGCEAVPAALLLFVALNPPKRLVPAAGLVIAGLGPNKPPGAPKAFVVPGCC